MMRKTISVFAALILVFSTGLNAQLAGWTYQTPFEITENTGASRSDYQVLLRVNTADLISQGHMELSGDDIRFGDGCGFQLYDFWIENYLNTDSTAIWVKMDSLPANQTVTIYMYYGNNGAISASSFSATFPSAIVSGGPNVMLTGNLSPGWLQIDAGDTLFITAGDTLKIIARKAIINGVIWGKGRGYPNGAPNSVGGGPGGELYSVPINSGAGGGAYGGNGGMGGYDAGDTPGAGGTAYGTINGMSIDMGSAGGSSDNTPGGDGGGGLHLEAEFILCNGKMDMSGTDGTPPGGARGGGGGSGGGILIMGNWVNLAGANISAIGGNGSAGTSTANDSGGGGSGGRIKLFHGSFAAPSSTVVSGGTGGPYGGAAPGQPGGNGTVFDTLLSYSNYSVQVQPENFYNPVSPLVVSYSDADLTLCASDTLTVSATPGYSNYDYFLDSNPYSSGGVETVIFNGLANGTYTISLTATEGTCIQSADTTFTIVGPVTSISAGQGFACTGSSTTLDAGAGFSSYSWSNSATTQSISVTNGNNYFVTVTDTIGCSFTASLNIADSNFVASISASDTLPCIGDTVSLSAAGNPVASFAWSTTESTQAIAVTANGTYSVTLTSAAGCTDDAGITLNFSAPPSPVILTTGDILDAGAGFTSYQWYFNGSPIAGGTSQTQDGTPNGSGTYVVFVTNAAGCEGSDTTSFLLELSDGLSFGHIAGFPNPVRDNFRIEFTSPRSGECILEITELSGKVIRSNPIRIQEGLVSFSMNVSELSAGLYLLRLRLEEFTGTFRLIKE